MDESIDGNSTVHTTVGKLDKLVVYEVNPLIFAEQNALRTVNEQLDRIAAMGVNVLWLMPINEEGQLKSVGSPYCVKNYKTLNSVMGTTDELKILVDAAHAKGMKVIMDWVANHTSWDNAWIENKSWYTQDAEGNIQSPAGFNWTDVADLNFDNQDMRTEMIECMKYWINTANVDGFRCDYAEGVPHDFWAEAITQLKILKGEDLLMLAETGSADYLKDGFDMVYSWDFAYKLQSVFQGAATLSDLITTYKNEESNLPTGTRRMRYITNHDMSSEKGLLAAYKTAEGSLAAFVIATALNGVPLIYSSQELAYANQLPFFNYVAVDWNQNPRVGSAYEKLMAVYAQSQALQSGETKLYANSEKVACIYRISQAQRMLVFINVTNEEQTVKVPMERVGEQVKELITGETQTLTNSLTLKAYQYMLMEIQ